MSWDTRTGRRVVRSHLWRCGACLLVVFALASCTSRGRGDLTAAGLVGSDSLDLANATYLGIEAAGGPVALADGRWEGVPYDSGGASRPSVRLVRTLTPQGDLDGDGVPESVALVTASAGGTGSVLHAAVVARRDGRWRNVATALVGDRVGLRDARIESRRLVLDVVQAGPEDPLCCPGELATRSWDLRGDSLVEQPAQVTGRLAPGVLAGGEWVLRAWSLEEEAAAEPEVTLRAEEGRWAGGSGCNRYSLGVTPGGAPGEVELGPVAGTRMACPAPAADVEARYLRALASVKRFQFMDGRLALPYESAGQAGVLLFERRRGE